LSFSTPILFLTFRNQKVTKKIFGYPKNNKKIQEDVINTRKIFDQINWKCDVKKKFSKKNLGIKNGVVSAIDWFFQNEDEGIIIEYDCFPSLDFFNYCEKLLNYYRNNEEIFSISGNNIIDNGIYSDYDFYFSSITPIWGWATWKRSWNLYKKKIYKKDIDLIIKKIRKTYAYPYRKFLEHNYTAIFNKTNLTTWSFNLMFNQILNSKKCIIPKKNLIKNIGSGEDATNAFLNFGKIYGMQKLNKLNVTRFPELKIDVNLNADNKFLKKCFIYMYLSYLKNLFRI